MYDYISLYSDDNYSRRIKTEVLEEYLLSTLHLRKEGSLRYYKEFNGVRIVITGFMADANGNYAFDTLNGVDEVNLIEIEVPGSIDEKIEEDITKIAFTIASEYSWCVVDHETSSKIYP